MTDSDAAAPGLRERKRRATRRAIQIAVLDLVSERGLEGVTVDEISRVADISPRTFFNYFPSKEEAMLGDAPSLPPSEAVEQFVSGRASLLEDLARFLVDASAHAMRDAEMHYRRHALLKQYPQLLAMRMATMRQFENEVADVVARRLVSDDSDLSLASEVVVDRARLVTLVAFATMRHAWFSWGTGEPSSDLSTKLIESFADLRDMFASEAA